MKALFVNTDSYIHEDMISVFCNMYGDDSADDVYYLFKNKNIFDNAEFEALFKKKITSKKYDCVLSTNFWPVLSRLCMERGIPYIAWSYDTPMNLLPCKEMQYDVNYIFLFDRIEAKKYMDSGFKRFYHLPLAVNTDRYDTYKPDKKYFGEVSFLGKLYRSKLPIVKKDLDGAMIEYIDKMVSIQRQTTGRYIIDDFISQPIIDEMNRQYKISGSDLKINKEQLSYAISEYVTYLDRVVLLEMLAKRFDTHLYSYDIGEKEVHILKNVKIHGPLNYYSEMPIMFKSSEINLNGSFRAAKSAIPMRALDILGCGGFLLSAAQPEIEESFEDRAEVVLYHSEEEALELADYYLKHDSERKRIATAGYERVKKNFRYEDRFRKMFEIAGIKR